MATTACEFSMAYSGWFWKQSDADELIVGGGVRCADLWEASVH